MADTFWFARKGNQMSGPSIALLARADEVIEQARCRLLALSGHCRPVARCLLSGVSGLGGVRIITE